VFIWQILCPIPCSQYLDGAMRFGARLQVGLILSSWKIFLLENLLVARLVLNFTVLMGREIRNSIHSSSSTVSVLCQMIPGQDLPFYFLKIHFNIIHQFPLKSFKWSLPFRFQGGIYMNTIFR